MTNVFLTPEKVTTRNQLIQAGLTVLEQQGWTVERIPGFGKSSARLIKKGKQTRRACIRTTQDQWIAFPRKRNAAGAVADGWVTLSDVDLVVAVSVSDDRRFAQVHFIEAAEMVERFDRAYKARMDAGYTIPPGRGVWVPLYHPDENDPVTHVGGGAGLDHPWIEPRIPLDLDDSGGDDRDDPHTNQAVGSDDEDQDRPLTMAEAKRGLAKTFGVEPSQIKITVEG